MSTETITFYQHILPMFTQYDRVMMLLRFDMYDYETVKKWAPRIILTFQPSGEPGNWSKLEGTHVMPVIPGPLPDSFIQQFQTWIDQGCQKGTPPFEVPTGPTGDVLNQFVTLSQRLTGFTDIGEKGNGQILAMMYYNRLLNESTHADWLDPMLNAWGKIMNDDTPDIETVIMASYSAIAQELIILWYNATINGAYDSKAGAFQYPMALAWRAARAHPQGWAPENTPSYWRLAPANGLNTGLGQFAANNP